MNFRMPGGARVRALTAVAVLAAAVVATVSAPPAQSAPAVPGAADCPDVYPVSGLTVGQDVAGLTVASGNTPDEFTGEVLGVLDDGIAVGIDMIIIDFSGSPVIDKNGIWAGMSGSPVYAEDGRLIGAVSYSLTFEASPVAGVTPAANMQALLGSGSSVTAKALADTDHVALPQRMQQRLVSDGLATPSAADQGLTQLPVLLGISGADSLARLREGASKLHLPSVLNQPGVLFYRTGAAPADPPGSDEIFAGSNLVASAAYGDFTAAAIGTTTMICDGKVVGFGHPLNFTGNSTDTMHGADVITVLKDDIGGSYKLANLTGPVGAITGDHAAGLSGRLGALPLTALVESDVTDVSTGRNRIGDTHVTEQVSLPSTVVFAVLNNEDVVFDHVGQGSALVHFTIEGTADGVPFSLTRTNRFADTGDISEVAITEMADRDLNTLLTSKLADVTINSIRATTQLDPAYRVYSLGKVQRKVGTHYVTLTDSSVVKARRGSTVTLRATLNSDVLGTKLVTLKVKAPAAPVGTRGSLALGHDSSSGKTASYDATSFANLLTKLANAPRNDQLSGRIAVNTKSGMRTSTGSVLVHEVVKGSRTFRFRVTR